MSEANASDANAPDANAPETNAPDAPAGDPQSSVPSSNVPPPAARPVQESDSEPIRELQRMAEQLARQHNRRLLYEYLRARRALR